MNEEVRVFEGRVSKISYTEYFSKSITVEITFNKEVTFYRRLNVVKNLEDNPHLSDLQVGDEVEYIEIMQSLPYSDEYREERARTFNIPFENTARFYTNVITEIRKKGRGLK